MKKLTATLALILLATNVSFAQTESESSVSTNLAQHFKTMDEVKKIEQKILSTPDKTVGPLTSLYICISVNIASQAQSQAFELKITKAMTDAIKSVPFGTSILNEILKDDPNFLDLNLDQMPYAQACKEQISVAFINSKISAQTVHSVVRLSEIGGYFLGLEMTSGL